MHPNRTNRTSATETKTDHSKNFLYLLILLINLLVLSNSMVHPPERGYDAAGHFANFQIYPFSIPTPEQSAEFFSAPLPYLIPSVVYHACEAQELPRCGHWGGKTAQLVNFVLSLGISYFLWRIAEQLKPSNVRFKLLVFMNLAILTVYYKSLTQVRGEPYVAFFTVLLAYYLVRFIQEKPYRRLQWALGLGLISGLLILSRQWGFLVLPAVGMVLAVVWQHAGDLRPELTKFGLIAALVTLLVGGWFYLYLFAEHGTVTAFNLESPGFSLANQPASFYRSTALRDFLLFKQPVRPYFNHTLFPILYSDTWGDYWGYFSYHQEAETAAQVRAYLGRVNLVALAPSLVLFIAFVRVAISSVKAALRGEITAKNALGLFSVAAILSSLLGFLWFLISFPEITDGDTNKAVYILQAYVLLALLAALYLDQLVNKRRWVFPLVMVSYLLVLSHNIQALLTTFR